MTNSKRQPYGFGSFVKKFTKPIKKVFKSPLGKAALLGGGLYGLGSLAGGGGGWGNFARLGQIAKGAFGNRKGLIAQLIRKKDKAGNYGGLSMGKLGLMGLLGAGTALPFLGGDDEEEIIEEGFDVTPSSIANIRNMARMQDPSLAFLPSNTYAQSGYYLKDGGIVSLANGGGVAEAKAEQMLKMEYQKYRNQGGTMSYQQFKMQVLQQAQGQGPMAQGQPQMAQPQMAAQGGRIGYAGAGPVGLEQLLEGLSKEEIEELLRMTSGNAQGGRVPAQEGGLMDLGGMEKDYRAEGGFVPIGGKEKADDVPARLSKNEFVFTADAVRNAGGGDIDAGAEVMQNMMDNLEQGGEISEESQGAQGMYNNMKQLETRVA